MERWATTLESERYEVSSEGRLRLKKPRVHAPFQKPNPTGNGYCQWSLTPPEGGRKQFLSHRVVWAAFNGPIPPKMQINHLNGVRSDNRLENLECCTCSENLRHRHAVLGVTWKGKSPRPHLRGENSATCKLSDAQRVEIQAKAASGRTQTSLAAEYSVTQGTISLLLIKGGKPPQRRMSEGDRLDARTRFEAGESVRSIGRSLGFTHESIRKALKA